MMMPGGPSASPVLVLSQGTKRESGRKVQLANVSAAKAIGDVVRTCLGPKAMLKMLMDPMGGIVMTNDGNAILREITVQHPCGKTLIEIARTQDEEVGDGTTSVVILTSEMLSMAQSFLNDNMHPTVIIEAYRQALEDAVQALEKEVAVDVDLNDEKKLVEVVQSCIGTKFVSKWSNLAINIAIKAVRTVASEESKEIDVKRYVRIEKLPGGTIEESTVLDGVLFNKDVTHPKMRRRIEKPRILLLDCNLEYKKGESQTNVEMMDENDFATILQQEEKYIRRICDDILAFKPDLVITEKGVSDLAQHFLLKANVTVVRRLKKSDNLRVAKATGATIVNRTDEIVESDIGLNAGLFEVRKIGDEYFTFIEQCENPKACSVLLRGASKDILNEVERNLQDALQAAKHVFLNPKIVSGGGAVEMEVARILNNNSAKLQGVTQGPYKAVASALEVIPKTLARNCGGDVIRLLTALKAKHVQGEVNFGVNGMTGQLEDMTKIGIVEPLSVKLQVYKTAVETAILLLRIDDIVSGSKKRSDDNTN